jgi:LmbE family N-acetylglucosaminyl deacetylase
MGGSIVAIMAHADDIEYCAGATLARHIGRGYRALYGVLSRCNSGWTKDAARGGYYTSSQEIVPQRRAEAAAAARSFGAELYQADLLENCYTRRDGTRVVPSFTGATRLSGELIPIDLDLPDGPLMSVVAGAGTSWRDNPLARDIAKLLIEWDPEIVIGQEVSNFNPDHFAAAQIVAVAWLLASEKKRIGPYWMPVMFPAPGSFQFPPLAPTDFVDVTGYEEACLRAMSCHRSQGGHLEVTHGELRANWKGWGARLGAVSAEAFREVYRAS